MPDLFDHLRLPDLVAFTGSASTAESCARTRPCRPAACDSPARPTRSTPSVLGTDAVPGTPEFDAYVKQLVAEMTTKAGQKCTAIRRAIVPAASVDAASTRCAPASPSASCSATRAPRASRWARSPRLEQRDEVLRRSGARRRRRTRHRLDGCPRGTPRRRRRGSEGAFVAPMLLRFADARRRRLHEVEAFGPVASVIGYDAAREAAALVARGGGSLVALVATHDPEVAIALATGIAAINGRVLFLDRDDARSSTGHGSPLPHLVHGGPGRAGGGEELGGIRAVLHHMQRTAVQGSPDDAHRAHRRVARRRRARPRGGEQHPFRKSLAELRIGDQVASAPRTVTLEDIETFANFTGDTFYAHMDEEAAAPQPVLPRPRRARLPARVVGRGPVRGSAPGPVLANYGLENLRFITPVSPGDSIRVELTAKQITPRETDEYGEVRWDAVLTNQNDEIVATYDVLTLVAKEPRPATAAQSAAVGDARCR